MGGCVCEIYFIMSNNSRADVCRLLAEPYDTKSYEKFGEFRSRLQASYLFSHIEELWYNEIVCLWITIYIYRERKRLTVTNFCP